MVGVGTHQDHGHARVQAVNTTVRVRLCEAHFGALCELGVCVNEGSRGWDQETDAASV